MGTRGYPPTEEKSFSFAAHKRERKGRERGGRSRERRERGRGEREDGGEKERRRRLNLGPPPRPPVLLPPPPLPPNGLASAEEREGGGRQMATLHSLSFRLLAFSSPFGFPKGDFTKPKQREAGSQKGRRAILAPADKEEERPTKGAKYVPSSSPFSPPRLFRHSLIISPSYSPSRLPSPYLLSLSFFPSKPLSSPASLLFRVNSLHVLLKVRPAPPLYSTLPAPHHPGGGGGGGGGRDHRRLLHRRSPLRTHFPTPLTRGGGGLPTHSSSPLLPLPAAACCSERRRLPSFAFEFATI